ncbi:MULTISPECIES: hypothetical protein [Alteromonadales]|uniref:Uncharacterized protein n=2 Tax=Alteromonadales TaxID=135622 RepID=A0ABY1GCZ8_9GAMM|nr:MULTISPECIES: hypothetical protein [Alteromonadales]MBE0353097.1 hypothetical protein [Pseudoalteromonas lipolytica LMEB 39]GHE78260.1 hypothetical protein GCM10011501_02550 [Thalassotalea profundi]SFT54883.1 hypothetical protein SAMN04487854_104239 [Pseudoalteromonas lipolytica]
MTNLELCLIWAGDHVIHSKVEYDFHIEQIKLSLLDKQTDNEYSFLFLTSACEAFEIKNDLPRRIHEVYSNAWG